MEMINIKKISNCCCCGEAGDIYYTNLKDKLFNAEGTWSYKRCKNIKCKTLWLESIPVQEDIDKIYQNYYTHKNYKKSIKHNVIKKLYNDLKLAYWSTSYHYQLKLALWKKILCLLFHFFPGKKRYFDSDIAFMPFKKDGIILDIGCGNGSRMKLLKSLGWDVEGIDFDENAVKVAKKEGLNVKLGSLYEGAYPDNYFNAISVIHVIEHITGIIDFLNECYRIMKPDSLMTIITPSSQSLGSYLFKKNWRGLEPPRHLQIFSIPGLKNIVNKTNFKIKIIKTINSMEMISCSIGLKKNLNFVDGLPELSVIDTVKTKILFYFEQFLLFFFRDIGEQIVLILKK
jgi:2-polyprenyl-3-methyl-5-hydroxy-6-metoxy-1,4-benzoquinol methylase